MLIISVKAQKFVAQLGTVWKNIYLLQELVLLLQHYVLTKTNNIFLFLF